MPRARQILRFAIIRNTGIATYEIVEHCMKFRFVLMMAAATFAIFALPQGCLAQSTLACNADGYNRKYCPVDTRGGVTLKHQNSKVACDQGITWGYDDTGIWVTNGCQADFLVQRPSWEPDSVEKNRCESKDGQRSYCPVDTRSGVRLISQISDADCVKGTSWGLDTQGIWVDKGCRAEFEVTRPTYQPISAQIFRCESNNRIRKYCSVDTQAGVRFVRKVSNEKCTQGSSWGFDRNGVWVDNNCRADFEILPLYKAPPPALAVSSRNMRCAATGNIRRFCETDTRGGVRLIRQLSRAQCTQNVTWGFNDRGIWVSGRCGADFEIMGMDDKTKSALLVR